MKKIFVILFLLISSAGYSQIKLDSLDERFSMDSLKSGRSAVMKLVGQKYQYLSVVFDQIASGDSVGIGFVTDSLHNKHNRDTIWCYLRNTSTFAEYPNGVVDSLSTTTDGVEVYVINPNVGKLLIKQLDRGGTINTVYIRVRGITY